MSPHFSPLDLVPLNDVLGSEPSPGARATLLAAGARIEALASGSMPRGWSLEAKEPGSDRVSGVSFDFIGWGDADDWLEFDVDLSRLPAPPLSLVVEASVGVACMCDTNHNMHYVRRMTWEVASADAAANAVEAAAGTLEQWVHEAGDAHSWRAWSGLPSAG